MDQLMVDVTDIPDAATEDTATLIGADGEESICIAQICEKCQSFPYEFICGINRRVPRVYCRNEKTVSTTHYLTD